MALSKFFDFIGNTFGGSDGKFSFEDLIFTGGKLDGEKLGGLAALFTSSGGLGLGSSYFGRPDQPVGYQGSVPDYTAVRRRVPTDDPNRRPGSGGRRYFTDMQYATTPESEPITLEEAQAAAEKQVEELSLAQAPKGISSAIPSAASPVVSNIPSLAPASSVINAMAVPTYTMASEFPAPVEEVKTMAVGGLAGLKKGKYLNGATDGMADKIPATIDRTQPAALSDGEFVIPADVVSHLGNGNSDAGAKVLTEMMDKVRMARTGNKKQGKEIDPNKFLPKV